MTLRRFRLLGALALLAAALPAAAPAQSQPSGPLRIEITEGVIEPLPIAIAPFLAATGADAGLAGDVAQVIRDDLAGSGLFRPISPEAYIARVSNFDSPVQYPDWQAINAQALVTGAVEQAGDRITVRFRLYDVFAETPLGEGLQFSGPSAAWRRLAHKTADQIYARITGENGYFDSRVVFIAEDGPKNDRRKRLAVMDYDGAGPRFLTDGGALVLAPRISADGGQVLYTSYSTGVPRIHLIEAASGRVRVLDDQPGAMTFSPRFAPDGQTVLFSLSQGGNTDLFTLDLASGARARLTEAPSIETAPSYAPDGRQIVFESDRSGSPQLYIMSAGGGEARRISFGPGRYGTPVWSPRGDLIAFTRFAAGRFEIGVMRPDGSAERVLDSSFHSEGPSWAPNGRVLSFFRESPGARGAASIHSVDIAGFNLRRLPTPNAASDPAWSPLLPS